MAYVETAQNDNSVTFSSISNCFYFVLWSGLVGGGLKVTKNDNFFNIFISFGLFPQDFEQVNEQLILKYHEMIRLIHLFV